MTAIGPGAAPPPWNPLAIIAFVLAFIAPPGAIVCGHIALGQVRRTGEQGRGLALAGAVLGWVFTGLLALFVLAWIAALLAILVGWAAFLPFALS